MKIEDWIKTLPKTKNNDEAYERYKQELKYRLTEQRQQDKYEKFIRQLIRQLEY